MKQVFALFIALFLLQALHAQDQIIKRNGPPIVGKVMQVGTMEIWYKMADNPDGPIYAIDKNLVISIVYANGYVDRFTVDLKDTANYAGQQRKAIKLDFLSPLLGYSQFSFEKSTGIGKSYELSLGIIGLGKSQLLDYYDNTYRTVHKNQFGLFASAGYKFNKLPDFLFGKTRFTHIMQGAYVKPIVYLGNYSENRIIWKGNSDYSVEKQHVTFGALQLEVGKQWVFGEKMLVDVYWGLGYGADNKQVNAGYGFYDASGDNYVNQRLGISPGLSLTYGLKAGLLIK